MQDRLSKWTDSAKDAVRDGTEEDLSANIGQIDSDVRVQVTKSGPILLTDCTKCGYQWKGLFTWPEVCLYYLGRFNEPLLMGRSQPSKQGVLTKAACNGRSSAHEFLLVVEWDSIRQWIDAGIRNGLVKPDILQARGR
jgi:hypothetical protein